MTAATVCGTRTGSAVERGVDASVGAPGLDGGGSPILPLAPGVSTVASTRPLPAPEALMPETPTSDAPASEVPAVVDEELVEESLVEEVSIDGMCGVY